MKTPADPVFDHMAAVAFEAIRDPLKRTTFFRANKAAIGREAARRDAGTPLPAPPRIVAKASEPFPMGLTRRVNGKVVSHIPHRFVSEPHGGIFGTAKRQ